MKILLVRHGEPDYTIDSLTPKGWREAQILSDRLVRLKDPDVYCSPRGRAQDTARATLRRTGWSMETLPWLAEFRSRIWHPETQQMDVLWDFPPREWTAQPDFFHREDWCRAPRLAGCDAPEIWQETKDGVDALLARYGYRKDGPVYCCAQNTDKTLVLFCHFGITAAICAYLLGISPVNMWQGFLMLPTSVTTLVTEERKPGEVFFRCTGFGDVSHLYAAGEPLSPSGIFPEVYTEKNGGRVRVHLADEE